MITLVIAVIDLAVIIPEGEYWNNIDVGHNKRSTSAMNSYLYMRRTSILVRDSETLARGAGNPPRMPLVSM